MKAGTLARHAARIILSAGVSLFIMALLFRLVSAESPEVGRAKIVETMRNTAALFILGYAVCTLAQTVLRSIRYRLLVAAAAAGNGPAPGARPPQACAEGDSRSLPPRGRVPGYFQTFLATAARNMFVDLLPARAGELSYVALLNLGYRVPADACFSSLAVSMFFDFLALLILIAAAAARTFFAADRPAWLVPAAFGLAVITAVFGLVLFVGIKFGVGMFKKLFPALLRLRPAARLLALAEQVADAARRSAGRRTLAAALALSLGVRFFKYAGFYLAFLGVAGSMPQLAEAKAYQVVLALLAGEGGAALPIPALMGFGAYEAGSTLTLKAFGYPEECALIAMFVMHVFSQAIDYLLGGLALIIFFLTAPARSAAQSARPGAGRSVSGWLAAAAAAAVCAAGLALLALQLRAAAKQGSLRPPPPGAAQEMPPQALAALRSAVRSLDGFIVWSSNRSGNHRIWRLSLPDLELSELTDHPHTHYYPRVSPDGNLLAFCRSQTPWVSQRDERSWDVYVMDLRDRSERLVAHNANAPTWSDDGRTLYFQLNSGEFAACDLGTGATNVLFRSGAAPVPDGVRLQSPHFNPHSGRLAVTLRGSQRRTALFSLAGEDTTIGGGCQAFWAPDYSFIYYVMDRGGHMRNMIMRYDLASGRSTTWFDMPGEWSHEYFPKLSRDGKYMVFGACAQGHEHDTADYEIFLWRTDSPPDSAVRVTFHTGNDCWPDIYLRQPK